MGTEGAPTADKTQPFSLRGRVSGVSENQPQVLYELLAPGLVNAAQGCKGCGFAASGILVPSGLRVLGIAALSISDTAKSQQRLLVNGVLAAAAVLPSKCTA